MNNTDYNIDYSFWTNYWTGSSCTFPGYFGIQIINDLPEVKKDGHKNMTLKEKFVLAITSEPQKSFRKAGITNGDDLLTDEGEKIFLSWLLSKNADAFKTEVVDELLKEEK
jgi:hypothetical protein